jgi:hypothetical protein
MYLCGANKMQHTQTFHNFNLQIMEYKTVLEFFAQAIIDGHEWAPAAMKNLARDSRDWPFDFAAKEKVADLYEALWMSFQWEQSPEGAKYWREIADKLLPE